MEFRYLIYSTGTTFATTILRESATNNPGVNEASLYTDFIIPEIQPLYLWRVVGSNVVPNTEEIIIAYEQSITSSPTSSDLVTYGELTGITSTKIDTVTGATDNIAVFTADGQIQDGGYSIPELTGLTTYTFVESGGTQIFRDGNQITIYSTVPSGTTVNWGDISGSLSNQTDLQNVLDSKADESDFTGLTQSFNSHTGDTTIHYTMGSISIAQSQVTNLSTDLGNKLETSVFNSYTGTSQPILDAALTGVTNLGTGTTLSSTSGRNITLKSISAIGGVSLHGDADNLIISGETNATVEWGDITGTLSNQTDLYNELTGLTSQVSSKLNTSVFNAYTGATDTRIGDIEDDVTGLTATKLNISDFNAYTGATDTRISDIENITNVAITGATNGLTKNGRNVELGGSLTKDTVISGTTFDFTVNTDNITLQSVGAINIVDANGVGGINLESDGGSVSIIGNTSLGVETTKIDVSDVGIVVTDNRATPIGIQYAADYSSTFQNRTLVDKGYVDAIASGLIPKANVMAATTVSDGNIDLTGATFTGTIDGYTLSNNDRVLITQQTLGSENGIYVYTLATNDFARSDDFNGNPDGEVSDGNLIPVLNGDTYGNTIWVLVTPNPIIIDTTSLTFTLFSSPIDLQAGVGIGITGQTVAVDGNSLAGNSISWTGNTFNVDINSGTLQTALGSKLDTSDFDTYSGATQTILDGKLETNVFTGYTASTASIIDSKLDIDVFTGYTASTTNINKKLQLIATGSTDVNTVIATGIDWAIADPYETDIYLWSGGSGIFIKSSGTYEIQYHITLKNDLANQVHSVGAYLIKNNTATVLETATATSIVGVSAGGELTLSPTVLSLVADDRLDLAAFRIGNDGTVNTVSGSVSILLNKLT